MAAVESSHAPLYRSPQGAWHRDADAEFVGDILRAIEGEARSPPRTIGLRTGDPSPRPWLET